MTKEIIQNPDCEETTWKQDTLLSWTINMPPALVETILTDANNGIASIINLADLKSPEVRKLVMTTFPIILKTISEWMKMLARNAVRIEWWIKYMFYTNTTEKWIVYLTKLSDWTKFTSKNNNEAFDSVLNLNEYFIATKCNTTVILEDILTWQSVEWTEDPYTPIDEIIYNKKVAEMKAKAEKK